MAKKKKKTFLKKGKDITKGIVPAVTETLTGCATFLGSKAATNKLGPKIKNEKIRKVLGPVKVLFGIGVRAVSDDPHVQAAGLGISISGADTSSDDFIPEDLKEKIGLGAADDSIDASASGEFDWDKAAEAAEKEVEEEEGDEEEDDISGAGNKRSSSEDEYEGAEKEADPISML